MKPSPPERRSKNMYMSSIEQPPNRASVFSPLAKAVLESFQEGVVVFDPEGNLTDANAVARHQMSRLEDPEATSSEALMPQLARLGGRVARLRVGSLTVGEAVYLPAPEPEHLSLADRERQAIVETLEQTGWRLAETARKLGISRTTLWRRLKTYGLDRDRRGNWAESA